MSGLLMWSMLVLGVACGVVPLAAEWLRDGAWRRACAAVGAFVVAVSLSSPASAAVQDRYIGPGPMSDLTCTPGELVVWPGGSEGVLSFECSEDGWGWCGGDHCWGYIVSAPPGDGGTATEVSLKPFDMSAEDGGLISAAILGVWLSAWGIRAVIDTLRDRKDGD